MISRSYQTQPTWSRNAASSYRSLKEAGTGIRMVSCKGRSDHPSSKSVPWPNVKFQIPLRSISSLEVVMRGYNMVSLLVRKCLYWIFYDVCPASADLDHSGISPQRKVGDWMVCIVSVQP